MTIIWLIVWLLNSTPEVSPSDGNSWLVSLLVCGVLDLLFTVNRD